MWKLKFEQSHKKLKMGLLFLIALSIVLSAGVYIASLVMLKQVSAMQSLVPVLTAKQNILNELSTLRGHLESYKKSKERKALESIRSSIIAIKENALQGEVFESEEIIKNKFTLIVFVASSYLKEIEGLTGDQVYEKSEAVFLKINTRVAGIVKFSDLEVITDNIRSNANQSLIISFMVFLFIGGGLFVGSITYSYISSKQMEKLDEVMCLTMVDDLTKLYNSRYFEERLMESINRVERFTKPLALIFMRLELPSNMEKEVKEMVLKEVALRLSKNTRVYDVNSRFEGTTFASIIHEVGEKETKIVIKRIKNAIEQKEIVGKVETHRGFISNFLNFGPRVSKNYATYVRVVIAVELYKTGKVGISDLMQKGAVLLDEAETAKNQIKVAIVRGKKTNGHKS
ncbi:MAG: hypothetical protein A2231_12930 [Candidatus Firestonebacteria bacterium RIFOXYA2_FULL_40_8]|nr:MAG: hypothetical protein A2231_12930 [Candidatus Firestonebacteria bacterium RIFOXYA2_FULL_40_8]